jgi:hypothetical protein
MERLALHLALHGAAVLTISIFAGLMVYLAILRKRNPDAWHVVHAGGSSRGIMLIALAAIIRLPALPFWKLATMAFLLIFFAWTSMTAMILRAVTGERGLGFNGSATNRLVWVLYAAGTVAVFPGCILLIHGLLNALRVQF